MKFPLVKLAISLPLCLLLTASALAGELENRLIEAAKRGDEGEVKLLLKNGANVNARDSYGATALMWAGKHVAVVQILLAAGADLKATSNDGSTALMWAESPAVVRTLIAKGADVDATSEDDILGSRTALMSAAMSNNAEKIQALLDGGADVNRRNNGGETALTFAAFNGWAEVAKLLLARGADVNLVPESGNTALIQAAGRGHALLVRLLIERRADVNARNKDGKTALMIANELIEKGQFGPVGSNGKMVREPLAPGVRKQYEEIVEILRAARAQ